MPGSPRDPHSAPLSHPHVGATRDPDLLTSPPPGYRPIERRVRLGSGAARWAFATAEVMMWGIQRRSGIRVAARDGMLREGDTAVMRVGLWPWDVPCRVTEVVEESDRVGFAYGTLPGHPERGEEAFLVEREGDEVWLRIRAFSRPATWIFWLGYPAVRLMQELYTRRYERALAGPLPEAG